MSNAETPLPEELPGGRAGGVGRRAGQAGRGDLRILLGAAPGVGKTYAMLREGRRLRDEGRDVVIGFVETHRRTETEEQIGDLEVIPRMVVRHRTLILEEMDVDAILHRKPEIALIDELAHTNAPGSPRTKRYQDVDALRDHGIDVITTLNIQHLAELQDVVTSITGVEVRETVPDQVLDDATDVQLVDLPVEVLLGRLEHGKIYPTEQTSKALVNFFREGNLTALRELALRRTAEGVDDRLSDLMLNAGSMAPATEQVMVLMDPHPRWSDVLRNAWRLASALHGDLITLTLTPHGTVDRLEDEEREVNLRQLQLAEDLGCDILVAADEGESPDDRGAAIVRLVREERITVLVLGVRPRSRRSWLGGHRLDGLDVAAAVLMLIDGLDVHLVKMTDPS